MKVTESKFLDKDKVRIKTTIKGLEYPEFELVVLTSRIRGKRGHYFSCVPLLKSMGRKDSFSSFITDYSTGVKRWNPRYEHLMEHCFIKEVKIKGLSGKYWFKAEQLIEFLELYSPKVESDNEKVQLYRDWVKAVIDSIPTTEHCFSVETLALKEAEIKRDWLDKEKDSRILNTFTMVAKMMRVGVKKDLIPFLTEYGLIYKQKKTNLAKEKYITLGYFKTLEIKLSEGSVPQTMITNKGYLFIKELWEENQRKTM